jgi:hypothetical protein
VSPPPSTGLQRVRSRAAPRKRKSRGLVTLPRKKSSNRGRSGCLVLSLSDQTRGRAPEHPHVAVTLARRSPRGGGNGLLSPAHGAASNSFKGCVEVLFGRAHQQRGGRPVDGRTRSHGISRRLAGSTRGCVHSCLGHPGRGAVRWRHKHYDTDVGNPDPMQRHPRSGRLVSPRRCATATPSARPSPYRGR